MTWFEDHPDFAPERTGDGIEWSSPQSSAPDSQEKVGNKLILKNKLGIHGFSDVNST